MRRWGIKLGLVLVLAALLLAYPSCGSAQRGEPVGRPIQLSSEGREGRRVFMHHCNQCHPGGAAGLGPAINNKPLPDFAIAVQVRNGFGAMPAFGEEYIPESELEQLLTYLDELRESGKK